MKFRQNDAGKNSSKSVTWYKHDDSWEFYEPLPTKLKWKNYIAIDTMKRVYTLFGHDY